MAPTSTFINEEIVESPVKVHFTTHLNHVVVARAGDVNNAELEAVEEPVAVNKGEGAIVVYSHLNDKPDTLLTADMSISSFTVPPAEHSIEGVALIAPTVGVPVQGGN